MAPTITPPPSKAKMFVFGIFLSCVTVVPGVIGIRMFQEAGNARWPLLHQAIGVLCMGLAIGLAVFTAWSIHRTANTSITNEGITQCSLRGEVSVRWSEITSVVSDRDTLRIGSSQGKLVVATGWYADPEEVKQTVFEMCAKVGIAAVEREPPPQTDG